MDDISNKTSEFGIGEAGRTPASTPLDEQEARKISQAQEKSWSEHCWKNSSCVECTIKTGEIIQISRRVYFSGTAGCKVMCEQHWLEYHASAYHVSPTWEAVTAAMIAANKRETTRPKRCCVCGSSNANYNCSAGSDLCSHHWDSY